VVWITALLSVVLSAFAFSMRTEVAAARNFKEEAEAAALAEAGIARGLAELTNARAKGADAVSALAAFESGEVALGRGAFRVGITDEERKVNLNRASAEVLAALLRGTGVDRATAETIADSVLDWRDPDDLHRSAGAEADYYGSLTPGYEPRNGGFETLEELLLVKGMTPAIFRGTVSAERREALLKTLPDERNLQAGEYLGVAQFLTIHGGGRVNVNTAGADVLVAVGVAAPEARAILDAREGGQVYREQPRGLQSAEFTTVSTTYRVESIGILPGTPAGYRIVAIVWSESGLQPRPRIVAWKEGV
jgi:general secretion pathway protein K